MTRIHADQFGIGIANLQIANTDWFEFKENHKKVDAGTDAGALRAEGFGMSPTLHVRSAAEEASTGDTFSDGAPNEKPWTGYFIAFYTIKGVDPEDLLAAVQPVYRQDRNWNYPLRFEGRVSSSSIDHADVVLAARKLHPQ